MTIHAIHGQQSADQTAVLDDRFWSHVRRGPGCWEWSAHRDRQGYGRLMRDGKNWLAHRYVFVTLNGPTDGVVRHTCDNPPCVRPSHLLVGTQADNIRDRQERGRHRPGRLSGERHSQAKLTLAQVQDIRSRPRYRGAVKDIAEEFGVTRATIHRILNGTGWREAA